MPVPASPTQHQPAGAPRTSFVARSVLLVTSAVAGGAALALAPSGAFLWALAVVVVGWVCLAVTVLVDHRLVHRARGAAAEREAETGRLRAEAARLSVEMSQLAGVTLPAVAERLREGTRAADVLATVPPASDPQLRRLTGTFAAVVEEDVRQVVALDGEYRTLRAEMDQAAAEHERFVKETLPAAVARLREGRSADTVLAEVELPQLPALRVPAESFIRELAHSERRAAAAQAASAKALSRVQAKSVRMLADLRDMQERHGEEVFGDLLKLDHSTSQLGLMTDRLALLMGGRSSRAWNKPIVMESILRGAVGRIAAYQRVRLHCSTRAAVSGFAAEGVMHLLAELMDNAANFSPPIDEVHVYVEDRSAGIVVTIEDSGLKMADAAMRRAEEAVTGRVTDLASLQGTRLGLAVVGRLAVKYGISVNYRPSSRGGTGVVVLLPLQLLAQQRDVVPHQTAPRPDAMPAALTPAPDPLSDAAERPAEAALPLGTEPPAAAALPAAPPTGTEHPAAPPELPGQRRDRRPESTTPNGLPVRAPGRTMAEAEREREQRQSASGQAGDAPAARRPGRDAGSRFGAFHRARQAADGTSGPGDRPGSQPPPAS
ncbi:ATP-binding protein [Streptomyces sp. SID5910]|uniref:ATP-binding protein n=1 Tax=Streptomyces sp. SID5910 TaxID=2690312 RepID=UPI00136B040A|nr:ATP-binding protein [Streptomyces sp. SID5910]MYR45933.1 ATP-binding protein [Streptomyces sp. SID5910]